VNEDAFATIQAALYGRASVLERLSKIHAPVKNDELLVLDEAAAKYEQLMEATQEASKKLAEYLKTPGQPSGFRKQRK
jgi:hypothetical protein